MKKRLISFFIALIIIFSESVPSYAFDNLICSIDDSALCYDISQNDVSENNNDSISDEVDVYDTTEQKNVQEVLDDDLYNEGIEDYISAFDFNNGTLPEEVPYVPESVYDTSTDEPNQFFDNEYASKYVPEKNSLTYLKNQGNYGTCWAHSATFMAENSLVKQGLADTSINLSELQLAYFAYNSGTDPLGNTAGDTNSCNLTYNGKTVDNILDRGGNLHFVEFLYSSWVGSTLESKAPYNSTYQSKAINGQLDSSLCYDDYAHMEYCYEVNIKNNPNAVKQLVLEYGGVSCSYCSSSGYYYRTNNAYYNPTKSSINHSVAIVGWDDNFPKENFNPSFEQPEGDGAWLIRNSWFTETGNESESSKQSYYGYFWMSYYDTTLSSDGYCYVFNVADNYDNNYQYDGSFAYSYSTGGSIGYYANIYQAKADSIGETLEAVSFASPTTNLDYTIKIYTSPTSMSKPNSGTIVSECTTTGTTVYGGVHTVKLNSPVYLENGTYYSVILILKKENSKVSIYTEANANAWYVNTATISKGQSFLGGSEKSWTDITSVSSAGNLRIKAYTSNGNTLSNIIPSSIIFDDDITSAGVSLGITATKKVEFTVLPETASNKRVIWSSSNSEVATVTSSGVVTGVKAGTATITATAQSGGVQASFSVTVTNTPGSISLDGYDEVEYQDILDFTVKTNFGDDVTSDTAWSVSDSSVLTINADGSIKATGCGAATLYADYNGIKNSIEITVYPRRIIPTLSIDKAGKITISWTGMEECTSYKVYSVSKGVIANITANGSENYSYIDESYVNYSTKTYVSYAIITVCGNYYISSVYSRGIYVGPTFEITYHLNGGSGNSNQTWYRSGNGFSLIAPTTKPTGYASFAGWYSNSELTTRVTSISSSFTGNLDLYAKYNPNKYTVYFYNNNPDASTNYKSQILTYDVAANLYSNIFSRANYKFAGWNTKTDGSGISYENNAEVKNLSFVNNGIVYLYAQWEPLSYTITFDVNGGNELSAELKTKNVNYNEAIGTLPSPTREDYTFEGWYTSALGTTKWTEDTIFTSTSNITLYAHWAEITIKGKVSFDVNGGTSLSESQSTKDVVYKKAYGTLPTPTRTGYDFEGWYTEVACTNKITKDSIVRIKGNHTLYANWTPGMYKVSFDVNGGKELSSSLSSKMVTFMEEYGTLPVPTRSGYDFTGWFTSQNGTTKITETSIFDRYTNITLYAHWSPKAYCVTLNGNGAELEITSIDVYFEQYYSDLPTPTRAGYDFAGWFDKAVGGNKITSETKFGANSPLILYAHWSVKAYTVTFNVNGGNELPADKQIKNVSYNSFYDELPIPTKKGFDFIGWYNDSDELISSDSVFKLTENQILFAKWQAKQFVISFAQVDEYGRTHVISTQNIIYGNAIESMPDIQEKTGYRAIGWVNENNDSFEVGDIYELDSDVILYPSYEYKTISLIFDTDGGIISGEDSLEFRYDETVPELPVPEKEYYDFIGWFTEDDVQIISGDSLDYSEEINLKAKYALHNYKIILKLQGGHLSTLDSVVYYSTYPNSVGSVFEDNIPENPSREKYTFDGWYTAAEGGDLFDFDDSVNSNVIIYAHWIEEDIISVDAPVASISNNATVEKGSRLILTTETPGAFIYYSYDDVNFYLYSNPIILESYEDIYAYACLDDHSSSEVVHFKYHIDENEWGDVIEEDRDLYSAGLWLAGYKDEVEYPGYPVVFDSLRVYDSKKLLKKGIDYTVSYSNNNAVGTASVKISGKGNYTSSFTKTFTIKATTKRLVKNISVEIIGNYSYTGEEIIPEILLKYDNVEINKSDFIITYLNNISSGKASVVIEAADESDYVGTKTVTFNISGINISECDIAVSDSDFSGNPINTVVVKYAEEVLTEGEDYSISFDNNIDAGTRNATITGIGQFYGTVSKTFVIAPIDFSNVNDTRFNVNIATSVSYSKGGAKPDITIIFNTEAGDYTLIENKDYSVSCSDNKALGTALVKVTGKGNYTGSCTQSFEITGKNLEDVTVQVKDVVYSSKKNGFKSAPVLIDTDGNKLKGNTDYSTNYVYFYTEDTVLVDGTLKNAGDIIESTDILPVGTVITIKIDAKGTKYVGSIYGFYRVVSGDISKATVTVPAQVYDGVPVTPDKSTIIVKVGKTILNENEYDIISYSNNNKKGSANLTIKGTGKYGGTKTVSFKIVEKSLDATVIFDGNGYTSGSMKNLSIAVGESKKLSDNKYKRNGFVFAGWNTCKDGSGDSYANKALFVTSVYSSATILYAQWTPIEYTITYHLNGGANNELNTAVSYTSDNYVIIKAPLREDWPLGYQFGGWYTDNTYKNKVSEIRKGSTGNINLYARWIAYSYTVVFNSNCENEKTITEGFSYGTYKNLTKNSFKNAGKIFKGWSRDRNAEVAEYTDKQLVCNIISPANNSSQSVTLYAVWGTEYDITLHYSYNENGKEKTSKLSYAPGSVTELPTPVRNGYDFKGWYTSSTFKTKAQIKSSTKGDKDFYAYWVKSAVNIKYDGNGADLGSVKDSSASVLDTIIIRNNEFKKYNYQFIGWNTMPDGSGENYSEGDVYCFAPTDEEYEISLFAQWIPCTYSVTYELSGGYFDANTDNYIRNYIYDEETEYELPIPKLDGFSFAGWYKERTFKTAISKISGKSSENIILYAKWVISDNNLAKGKKFVITYHMNSETDDIVSQYEYGKTTALISPSRTGYSFSGWFIDKSFKTPINSISTSTVGDVEVYAKWTSLKYTIVYDKNVPDGTKASGSMTATTSAKYGQKTKLKKNAYKVSGYTFLGWSENPEDTEATYEDTSYYYGGTYSTSKKLYAIWQKDTYSISYANVDAKEFDTLIPYSYDVDMIIDLPEPSRAGDTFLGWYTDSKYKNKITSIKKGTTKDIILYAKWANTPFSIGYVLNGGHFVSQKVGFVDTYDISYVNTYRLPIPEKDGFVFAGWYSDATLKKQVTNVSVTKGITLYAKWTEE